MAFSFMRISQPAPFDKGSLSIESQADESINKAFLEAEKGDYESSLYHIDKSIWAYKKHTVFQSCRNLVKAMSMIKQESYVKAREYLNQLLGENQGSMNSMYCYILANTFIIEEDLDSARIYLEQGLDYLKGAKNRKGELEILDLLIKESNKALQYKQIIYNMFTEYQIYSQSKFYVYLLYVNNHLENREQVQKYKELYESLSPRLIYWENYYQSIFKKNMPYYTFKDDILKRNTMWDYNLEILPLLYIYK